ncbi:MAG: DUF3786 domain-containing protein [Anaerolineae bacterium]|nr:DUF3786 domain-containing protein [Anaerolineae bacterium]
MSQLAAGEQETLSRFRNMLASAGDVETSPGLAPPLWQRLQELRTLLRQADPGRLAERTGASLAEDSLYLLVWEQPVAVDLCDFVARRPDTGLELDPLLQVLLAYYLYTADGTLPAGTWISFTELPDGLFYAQAFQSYTGHRLSVTFGNDVQTFTTAALAAGGKSVSFGDRAFAFSLLPWVSLLVVCWQGDEDFPASYRILFDANAGHHLTTDACAVLGAVLTRRLLRRSS